MREITIIALHNKLQWRDTDAGNLESLLAKILEGDPTIELIVEEANKLPTIVGQRIAFRFNKPWASVDMDEMERQRKGIYDDLQSRAGGPLDDDSDGCKEYYSPKADGIREEFWLAKVNGYRLDRVVFLCGLLHLSTVAAKFRDRGWIVEEINVCGCQWYVERFGTLTIVEENGHRWCECRPNSKTFQPASATQKPQGNRRVSTSSTPGIFFPHRPHVANWELMSASGAELVASNIFPGADEIAVAALVKWPRSLY